MPPIMGAAAFLMAEYMDLPYATVAVKAILPAVLYFTGIFIAVLAGVVIYYLIEKTKFGYELKACGYNRDAARYAGINETRSIVLSMAIAGGLAGGGAALYYLSGNTEFFWSTYQTLPAEGFNGIPVALLGLNNPIGIIFSGLFVAYLNQGGFNMQVYGFAPQVIDIIISVVIYFAAFSLLLRGFVERRVKRREEKRAADGRPAVSGRGPQEGGGAE